MKHWQLYRTHVHTNEQGTIMIYNVPCSIKLINRKIQVFYRLSVAKKLDKLVTYCLSKGIDNIDYIQEIT